MIEDQITLNIGEQKRLQRAVGQRVYELETGPRLFPELYRAIKDCFGVPSYKYIKKTDLQSAIRFVDSWKPNKKDHSAKWPH